MTRYQKFMNFHTKKPKLLKFTEEKTSNKHDEKFLIFKFNTLIDFMSLII